MAGGLMGALALFLRSAAGESGGVLARFRRTLGDRDH
jgi:hypothetical protein